MSKYNEEYISTYEAKDMDATLHNGLTDLFDDFKNRYFPDAKVDGNTLAKLEAIDHYVTANFLNDYDFVNSASFKNYLTFLKRVEFEKSSYAFQNNFINNVGDNVLTSLLGKDKFNEIDMVRKSGNKLVTNIINRMNKKEKISQQELDITCDYFAFNRDINNKQHSDLIRYIFNELTKPDTELSCSCFVLDAITSYLPKFFKYDKDFDAQNIRVLASDTITTAGVAYPNRIICINRHDYQNASFQSSENIKNSYTKRGNDYTHLLHVVFHELYHEYQISLSEKKEFSDSGYAYVMTTIINNQLNDYKRNHDGNEIEIDASEKGWLECAKFYEKFISDKDLKKKLTACCYTNAIKTNNRRLNSIKTDEHGNEYVADFYDVNELSNIILNNPSYLEKFPMLRTFYKENGEINPSFITNPKLKDSTIAKKYTRYLALKHPDLLLEELNSSQKKQLKTGLYNIYRTAMTELQKDTKITTESSDNSQSVVQLRDEDTKSYIRIILDNCVSILTMPSILMRHCNTSYKYLQKLEEEKRKRK